MAQCHKRAFVTPPCQGESFADSSTRTAPKLARCWSEDRPAQVSPLGQAGRIQPSHCLRPTITWPHGTIYLRLSRVNHICRLASISFAGSPPRPGRVAGQRCRPPLVHVQVRATDTRGSDLHDAIVGVLQLRVWHIFRGDTEWGLVKTAFITNPSLAYRGLLS